MPLRSRLRHALWGALLGMGPGTIACMAYVCVYLAVRGDFAAVFYESYILPMFACVGAALGLTVGGAVGWRWCKPLGAAARPRAPDFGRAWRLALLGLSCGLLVVLLAAALMWAAGDGRSDTIYLVKVGQAGATVGAVVALAVGFFLGRELPAE